MRIVSVHYPNDIYGASRVLLRMTRYFVEQGHDMAVVLPPDGPLGPLLTEAGATLISMKDLAVIERSAASPAKLARLAARSILSARAIGRTLGPARPDVVHSNISTLQAGALAARMAGIPHIWHLRENFSEFRAFWPAYQRWMLSLSQKVICISRDVAGQFSRPSGKIAIAYDGIDIDEIGAPPPEAVQALRARYGLQGKTVFAVVGRIKLFRKGQEVFVRAAARLKGREDVAFAVIGMPFPGNEEHLAELQALAGSLGLGSRFVHIPEITDLDLLYGLVDVLVLPSCIPEPFGMVILEAMTRARAVIASNAGGAAEQVIDGQTGLLVPINDDAALAAAMEQLIMRPDLRAAFGAAGRARAASAFDAGMNYAKILKLFEEAAQRRARPLESAACSHQEQTR